MAILQSRLCDITALDLDAIVNAANKSLLGGGGVDGAIHRAAGPQLLAQCRALNGCSTGEAKITAAYNLPCRYIVHTVGPIWQGGHQGEAALLANCYQNTMALAEQYQMRSIAFPAISCGVYGYPLGLAAAIAVDSVRAFIESSQTSMDTVLFCCFSEGVERQYQLLLSG